MNTEPNLSNGPSDINVPAWSDCDFFCIHNYADAQASSCGWRGRLRDVDRDSIGTPLLCPRCHGATLLRIPLRT